MDGHIVLNPEQGGFQRNVNCVMTSLMLRECIAFAAEHGSRLYTCFLDAKQAFDHAWIQLLLLKLYNTGVDVTLFRAISSFYTNCYSRVIANGYTSDWIPILQGTRQGQCSSPMTYLLFINDLMIKIENCETVSVSIT